MTLKPCPFCGKKGSWSIDRMEITCSACGARGPDFCATEDQAVTEWNNRKDDAIIDLRTASDAANRLVDAIDALPPEDEYAALEALNQALCKKLGKTLSEKKGGEA